MIVPGRIYSIAHKEARHIFRDPLTLAMAVGMPVLLVTFFGFVYNFDVRNVRLVTFDHDQTLQSRQLADVFAGSQYFKVSGAVDSGSPVDLVDKEAAKAVLVIEPGFGKDIARGATAKAQILLDGADNQTAGVVMTYLAGVQKAAPARLLDRKISEPVELRTRFLFNPELNSRWFVVPGLFVVIMGILSILLTALTIAREWETGSMELLLSTPAQPAEIIIGKLAPYVVLGLGGVLFVYLAARFGFGIPFRGSHVLFLFACLMFLSTTLAQGLMISVITRQQQLAMQMANMTGLMPSLLLSGFIFPVESMPTFFRYLTAVIPARWFMMICRGIFLKGEGLADLAKPLTILAIINFVFIVRAVKKFKKDLEP
jgi:ABC-2 type transport system permease protein